ncbi:MAG: sigma-70 family RNA polymerase sigma factor [Planctomycetes bacterium]|nr:sigma-70 family RNA polymerase sigma factor [Planctomycetota bacterium]
MGFSDETSLGGEGTGFPETRWSAIVRARETDSPDRADALRDLCAAYWKPIYAYFRSARRIGNEDAKDMTQDFVLELVEGGLLGRFRPERGSFRSYLRGALRLFLLERHREGTARKRGGGRRVLSIENDDTLRVDDLSVDPSRSPEEAFDHQWAISLLDQALADLAADLRAAGKDVPFEVFRRYDLEAPPEGPPTYAQLADEFGIKPPEVGNYLTACRRRLRERVIARIREYAASEAEVTEELIRHFL